MPGALITHLHPTEGSLEPHTSSLRREQASHGDETDTPLRQGGRRLLVSDLLRHFLFGVERNQTLSC